MRVARLGVRGAVGALAALLPVLGWADDAALRRCRAITEPAARLACYDALPLAAAPVAAKPAAPATPAAAAAPAMAPAAPSPAAEVARFGLERQQPKAELEGIESTIPGPFDGWSARSQIKLANGQVWQIADQSSAYFRAMHDAKVRIRRGVFGNVFFLDIEGQNRSPQVRRVQ